MRSFLLFLCISLFGSALASSQCQVNGACCYCISSTCTQFKSNPAYGFCDDGTYCGTCSSSTTSSSGASSSGASSSGASSSGASSSGTTSFGTSSSGTSNGQYASMVGKYSLGNHGGSCDWANSYIVTATGVNTYQIIPQDNPKISTASIQQSSDYTFSISASGITVCSGTKDGHSLSLVCNGGCFAVLTGGSGMVVANIFLIVAAVSALLAL
ncbi:hypothetical protein PROFUN_01879 [Planoprotostelium fungivorum]|uniref:Uncharacterized protein n=1 Tax=Planoprotostelium fungivorum TaxID=1890364 RepID=A0A2P6NYZ6_9EUKA|nr:hypothetical protein PROFUN_01879 [Planoprotostelium fungivorum]